MYVDIACSSTAWKPSFIMFSFYADCINFPHIIEKYLQQADREGRMDLRRDPQSERPVDVVWLRYRV